MKTKILATIGPASNKRDVLSKLIAAGVRIFRLNFSHGDSSSFVDLIKMIRELEIVHKTPITILQDLSGPKIRIGTFPNEGSLNVLKGDQLLLGPSSLMCNDEFPYIPFDHPEIFAELEQGDRLVLADGTLQFRVVEHREDGLFKLEANNNGIVTSRKGLALPGKSIPLPALTEKDKKDLVDGLALGVDAVALSFVQSPEDIREAKSIIRSHSDRDIPVIASSNAATRWISSTPSSRKSISSWWPGDTRIECPLPELPAMQKRIIRACNRAAKPVIVATQMLLSMVSSPSPTRAETTDVANAVLDGADCVMLSEETAMGNYPVETVQFMSEIASKAEELMAETRRIAEPENDGTAEFLAYAACLLAQKANAKSIVAHSLSGTSARLLSARRPVQTIHALTPDVTSLKALNFSWGVLPHQVGNDNVDHLARAERFIASSSLFGLGEDVVITAGQPTSSSPQPRGTNLVKIYRK
ncbi:MAG: pyruvate kinase [Bilophila wadsworthia]